MILEVEDDGRGFDHAVLEHDVGDRFGLYSIEERLYQLGGEWTLDTAPGRGTRVRLSAVIPGDAP